MFKEGEEKSGSQESSVIKHHYDVFIQEIRSLQPDWNSSVRLTDWKLHQFAQQKLRTQLKCFWGHKNVMDLEKGPLRLGLQDILAMVSDSGDNHILLMNTWRQLILE